MEQLQRKLSRSRSHRHITHKKSLSQPIMRNSTQRIDLTPSDNPSNDIKATATGSLSLVAEDNRQRKKTEKFNFKIYNELHKDLQGDAKYDNHAADASACLCPVCLNSPEKNENPEPVANAEYFALSDHQQADADADKDFSCIMKSLYIARHTQKTLRLCVPDTAILTEGEIKFIVKSHNKKSLQFATPTARLSFQDFQKYLHERFLKQTWDNIRNSQDRSSEAGSPTIRANRRSNSPSHRRFGKVNPENENEFLHNKEFLLMKYKDDATQVMSELEFIIFIQKHLGDKIWKDVQYIQMFIKPNKGLSKLLKLYFLYDKEKENALFKRSRLEILSLNGDISKFSSDFMTSEQEEAFESSLKESNEEIFCMYKLYKLVHYLEIISSIKILRMAADFLQDDAGVYWLLNLSGVKHVHQPKDLRTLTDQKIFKKTFEAETGKLKKKLDIVYRGIERKESGKLINKILKQHYDVQKKNLKNEFEIYLSESITDYQFAKMMPDVPFKLSGLLKERKDYNDVKRIILKQAHRLQNERLIREGALEDKTRENKPEEGIIQKSLLYSRHLSTASVKNQNANLQSEVQTTIAAGRSLKSLLNQGSIRLPERISESRLKKRYVFNSFGTLEPQDEAKTTAAGETIETLNSSKEPPLQTLETNASILSKSGFLAQQPKRPRKQSFFSNQNRRNVSRHLIDVNDTSINPPNTTKGSMSRSFRFNFSCIRENGS